MQALAKEHWIAPVLPPPKRDWALKPNVLAAWGGAANDPNIRLLVDTRCATVLARQNKPFIAMAELSKT